MIPTALSQVAETLVRSVFVLLFAYLLLPYGGNSPQQERWGECCSVNWSARSFCCGNFTPIISGNRRQRSNLPIACKLPQPETTGHWGGC